MNFMEFILIFHVFFPDLIPFKKGNNGLFNRAGHAKLTWRGADTWRDHTSSCGHMSRAYVV